MTPAWVTDFQHRFSCVSYIGKILQNKVSSTRYLWFCKKSFSWDFKRSHYSCVGHYFDAWQSFRYLATFFGTGRIQRSWPLFGMLLFEAFTKLTILKIVEKKVMKLRSKFKNKIKENIICDLLPKTEVFKKSNLQLFSCNKRLIDQKRLHQLNPLLRLILRKSS